MKKPSFLVLKKNSYHTIPIYGNSMKGISLMATQSSFETALKFLVFFQPQIEICTQTNIFQKNFFFACKTQFLCK